uniref:Cytochrome c oxidase polypeptide VIIc n=1 Tax=Panagrellus redivivus TaxID=6233 RepID=A0A7E4UQZ4_PANRE
MSSARLVLRSALPVLRQTRLSSHSVKEGQLQLAKFQGQTPTGFINDGWALSRVPFNVRNKWLFATKAITFLAIGFWAPFIVVEYQLRKANQ